MRKPKQCREYATPPMRRFFRAELTACPTCQTCLRRYATLSQRTVITLNGPVRLIHRGYRCPNAACETRMRSYRSAAADALALPGFTFGLDIVILVGQLRLAQHQTLDEVHQTLSQRLAPFGITISRREVLYLFDAYTVLLRAGTAVTEDAKFREQVEANGGLIISIDGIRPDVGHETIYLVRDVLTARVLVAENVTSSETAVIKSLLAPVAALGLPVIGAISDAQESLVNAIAELWPDVPHQTCQFHASRVTQPTPSTSSIGAPELLCAKILGARCMRPGSSWPIICRPCQRLLRKNSNQNGSNWRCWPIMRWEYKPRSISRERHRSSIPLLRAMKL